MERQDHPDLPRAIAAVRRERRARPASREPGEIPAMVVVADQPDDALVATLSASGWRVSGLLTADVFDGLLWAARTSGVGRNYVELPELLLDPTVDAACIAAPGPGQASMLTALLHAGLHVLLPAPAELSTEALRQALEAAEEAEVEHAVAFAARWTPATLTVGQELAAQPEPPRQVTVRGWPTGSLATAELVDVLTAWCGDVAAVCADPDQLPAQELPGGARVRWALLTEHGSTVLVAHDGAPQPTIRLTCRSGRLEMAGADVRWEGRPPLPLVEPDTWLADDAGLPIAEPPAEAPRGLIATANRLALAAHAGEGGWLPRRGGVGTAPAAGTLRDLFVVSRVREALRLSAVEHRWVETA